MIKSHKFVITLLISITLLVSIVALILINIKNFESCDNVYTFYNDQYQANYVCKEVSFIEYTSEIHNNPYSTVPSSTPKIGASMIIIVVFIFMLMATDIISYKFSELKYTMIDIAYIIFSIGVLIGSTMTLINIDAISTAYRSPNISWYKYAAKRTFSYLACSMGLLTSFACLVDGCVQLMYTLR
uniref:Uncharacterized protein n=1 Tax=viral metagenome TaxID=1070528 RepID=A0A6C0E6R8_9ZZZZ